MTAIKIGPPISRPSNGKFLNMLDKMVSGKVINVLSKYVDIDYMDELNDHDRCFLAMYLIEWYETVDKVSNRKEIYDNYERITANDAIQIDHIEDLIDNSDIAGNQNVVKVYTRKLVQSYTIKDYMPSKLFDEDKIIDYIDYESGKNKSKAKLKVVK